jgi:hypothetical protein
MRIRSALLMLLTVIFAVHGFTAHSQTPIPTEKRREIHKLDPMDVIPEQRVRPRDRGRRPQAGGSAASGNNAASAGAVAKPSPTPSPTPPSTDSATKSPAEAAVYMAQTPSPTPSPTATPSPQNTPSPSSTVKPSPTQAVSFNTQPAASPGQGGPASATQPPARSKLSLPIIFTLLGLILVALVVAVVKLKDQLREP